MAGGPVVIQVEMRTDGIRTGVEDIRAGCGRAAAAAERTGRSMTRAMSAGTKALAECGESAQRTGALVRASCDRVRDGMRAVTAENGRASAALKQMRADLNAVKLSLATAFAPVVTAAAPLLIKFSNLVAKAANYVAMFFAVLSGKNSYKKAVAAQDAITESVAGTGAAAKEAAKNLSGLDELNTWQENEGGSGGGGSGSGTDVGMEEVATGEATDFVVRLRDILFQWDDLNPELIAEKLLTGLCAAAGGVIGWTIGGPLGGMVGLTLGALLGVKLSQLTFNGDGKIDKKETAKLIMTAVSGLLGGILGFVVGGPLGAAIGFTVSAGISAKIGGIIFDSGERATESKIIDSLVKALTLMIGGAAIGFAVGGPLGAAIGATIGVALTLAILSTEWKNKDDSKLGPAGNNPVGDLGLAKKEMDEAVQSGEVDLQKHIQDSLSDLMLTAPVDVDVQANIVGLKDKLKAEQKIIDDARVEYTGAIDGLSTGQKTIDGGIHIKTFRNGLTAPPVIDGTVKGTEFAEGFRASPTVSAIARGDSYASNLPSVPVEGVRAKAINYDRLDTTPAQDVRARATQYERMSTDPTQDVQARGTSFVNGLQSSPIIETVSRFASAIMGLKDKDRVITTWAQYDAVKRNLTDPERTITTWAQYDAVKRNLTDPERTITTWAQYDAVKRNLTDPERTITTWSQFDAVKWNLTEKERTQSAWAKFASVIWSLNDGQRTAEVIAKATKLDASAVNNKEITVKAKISEIVGNMVGKVKSWLGLSTGGIYTGGRWQPIEGYASGGNPRSARLFYANENGMPELVGRIGSSTAVMNNGQIVSSVAAGVYRAVAAAMGQMGGWFRAMSARLGDIPPAIELLAAMPAQTPQPTLATGTVLPPKTVYLDGPVQGLADAVSGLRSALERQDLDRSGTGREPTYNVNLNVDGRTLLQVVLRQGRVRQMQGGGNPFMELMGG